MHPGRHSQPGQDPSSLVQYPTMYYKSSSSSKYNEGDGSSSSRSILADSYERIRNEVRTLHKDSSRKRNRSPSPDHHRSQKDRGHSTGNLPSTEHDNVATTADPLSMLLGNKEVSLSSLLEAAMNPSSPGSSKRTEDPIMKKTILSKCERKIAQLYRHRMNGMGTFFPLITQAKPALESEVSSLMFHHPRLEFNMEHLDPIWTSPEVSVESCVDTSSERKHPSPRKGSISPALEATKYANKPLPQQSIETVTMRNMEPPKPVFVPQYPGSYYNNPSTFPMNSAWPSPPNFPISQNAQKDELQIFEDYLKDKEMKKKRTKKSRSRSRSRERRRGRSRSRERRRGHYKSRHSRRSRSRNRCRHRRSRSLSLSPSPKKNIDPSSWTRSPSPPRSHYPSSDSFNIPQPSSHSSWNPSQPPGIYGFPDNPSNNYPYCQPYSAPSSTVFSTYDARPRPFYHPPPSRPQPPPSAYLRPPFQPFATQPVHRFAELPPPPGTTSWNLGGKKKGSSNLIEVPLNSSSHKIKPHSSQSSLNTIEIIDDDDDDVIAIDAPNDGAVHDKKLSKGVSNIPILEQVKFELRSTKRPPPPPGTTCNIVLCEKGKTKSKSSRHRSGSSNEGNSPSSRSFSNSNKNGDDVVIVDASNEPHGRTRENGDKKGIAGNTGLDSLKAQLSKRLESLHKVVDTIRDVQRKSFDYSTYIKGLETSKSEFDGSYTLHEKLLCRLIGSSKDLANASLRVVIPDDQTMKVLEEIHLAYHDYNNHKIYDMIVNLFNNDRNFSIIKVNLAFEACKKCSLERKKAKSGKINNKGKGGNEKSKNKGGDKGKSYSSNKRDDSKGPKGSVRETNSKDKAKPASSKPKPKLPHDGVKITAASPNKQKPQTKMSDDTGNEPKDQEKFEANDGNLPKAELSDKTKSDLCEDNTKQPEEIKVTTPVQSQENNETQAKTEAIIDCSTKENIPNENPSNVDFKYRVRQVQIKLPELETHITSLESSDKKTSDPNLLLKAGMLCRRIISNGKSEVKIVVNQECLTEMVRIVHTMAAIHSPIKKTTLVFNKHFTQIEGVDKMVTEIVNNCEICQKS